MFRNEWAKKESFTALSKLSPDATGSSVVQKNSKNSSPRGRASSSITLKQPMLRESVVRTKVKRVLLSLLLFAAL